MQDGNEDIAARGSLWRYFNPSPVPNLSFFLKTEPSLVHGGSVLKSLLQRGCDEV
jgi:hypothetical protein